ncbi:hypothetical protein, partial [Bradyrhizobium jicamae]|uniref:hypothetical protein n=1 Tax=Bradyrhizobium jicamae TaxID=280332 RepID=UPI001BA446F3
LKARLKVTRFANYHPSRKTALVGGVLNADAQTERFLAAHEESAERDGGKLLRDAVKIDFHHVAP